MGNAATARTLRATGTSPAASLRTGGLQDELGNSTVAAMLGAPATERVKNPHEGDSPLDRIRGGLSSIGGFLADQGWALLRRTAPELEPILRKGVREWLGEQLTGALGWLLDMLTAPLRAVSGAAGTLNRLFKRMVDWMRAGAANLVTTSCKLISDGSEQVVKVVDGIEDAEQTGLAELKEVAGEAGDFLGGLWDKLGEPVADLLGKAGSEAWARIQQFGQWLWDKTEPIRDAGSMAWNWLKDIIGIGSGAEGRNGIIQWVQARAEGVWTWVKSKLGPIPTPLKVAGGALLLLSPAGPLLAAGALAFGVIKGAKWLWDDLRDPDALVRMRTALVEEILPQLRSSVGAVKDFINNGVAWLGDTLTTVSEGLRGLADKVTAPILAPLSDLVGWFQDQNDKLVRWVDEHAKPLAKLVSGALQRLHNLGGQLLDVLKQVITAAANPFGISGLILGAVWQALPACMRSAILKFLLRLVQGALRLMPATALGPLGAVLREAMIGFVNRALEEQNLAELERVADRFARLATKGSWDFTVGYGLGLLKGVWDGIAGPFILLWDIAKLLGNAVVWLGKLALTALTPAGRALVASIRASWDTINAEIRPAVSAFLKGPKDPGRIFKLIRGVMNQIASTARSAGASVFDELMTFLHKPDRQLGESIGFLTGVIVFEVVLTVLTAGGYAAKAVIQRVSRLFTRAMTKVADLLRQLGGLYPKIKNVLDAVVRFAGTNAAMRRIVSAADKLLKNFLALLRLAYGVDGPAPRKVPERRPEPDDLLGKPAQLSTALLEARAITALNEQASSPVPVVLSQLGLLKRRYRWIKSFKAEANAGTSSYSIYLIASQEKVTGDYEPGNEPDIHPESTVEIPGLNRDRWSGDDRARIERELGGNLDDLTAATGRQYRYFDHWDPVTRTMTSIKTIDPRYFSVNIGSTGRGQVDEILRFRDGPEARGPFYWRGPYEGTPPALRLGPDDVGRYVLRIGYPSNVTPAQLDKLKEVVRYGQSKGILVFLVPIRS